MYIYHGSDCEILMPTAKFSRINLEFGKGFYMTTSYDEGVKWAKNKSNRSNWQATLNPHSSC
jgi:hypothetical protein